MCYNYQVKAQYSIIFVAQGNYLLWGSIFIFQQGQHLHVPTGFNDNCEEKSTSKTMPQGIQECVRKYYQPKSDAIAPSTALRCQRSSPTTDLLVSFPKLSERIVPTPTSVAEALYKLHCIVHYDGSILQQDRSAQVLSQTGCVESLILYTRGSTWCCYRC